jgi:hypothetical protein
MDHSSHPAKKDMGTVIALARAMHEPVAHIRAKLRPLALETI